jgi:hypothetical protein
MCIFCFSVNLFLKFYTAHKEKKRKKTKPKKEKQKLHILSIFWKKEKLISEKIRKEKKRRKERDFKIKNR